MDHSDAADQAKLTQVAQAIAHAMGHEERWRNYIVVARMQIAGYAACQKLELDQALVRKQAYLTKRRR